MTLLSTLVNTFSESGSFSGNKRDLHFHLTDFPKLNKARNFTLPLVWRKMKPLISSCRFSEDQYNILFHLPDVLKRNETLNVSRPDFWKQMKR
jgi:hypothetical protein